MLGGGPHERIQNVDERGQRDGDVADGLVLPAQEGFGALLDGVRDDAHGLRARVAAEHVFHEVNGKRQPKNADSQNQIKFHDSSRSSSSNCIRAHTTQRLIPPASTHTAKSLPPLDVR